MLSVVLLVAVLVMVVVFLNRAQTYGGLRSMVRTDLREDRHRLNDARRALKKCKKDAAVELRTPRAAVQRAQASHDRRVAVAARAVEALVSPGQGPRITRLGEVDLFTHVLRVGRQDLELRGLQVECQLASDSATLAIRLADGQVVLERFDTSWRDKGGVQVTETYSGGSMVLQATQQRIRTYTEEQVLALTAAITSQAIVRTQFLDRVPVLLPAAQAELDRERAATSELDAARAALAEAEAHSPAMKAVEAAQAQLAVVERDYAAAVASKGAPIAP